MIISRESRKSRESSVPMNMPHTDLTKRVRRPKGLKAISQRTHRYTRVCHPACTLGAADSKGEATCLL